MSEGPQYIYLRCPECGAEKLRIKLDDVVRRGLDGNPILNPEQAPGLCEECRHREPGKIAPVLDLKSEKSVDGFMLWYMKQKKSEVTHKDMNKARLCALTKHDVAAADKTLREWIVEKVRKSQSLLGKLGMEPRDFRRMALDRFLKSAREKIPELSAEDALQEAEAWLDDAVCKTLNIEPSKYRKALDGLIAESDFLSANPLLKEIAGEEKSLPTDSEEYYLTDLEEDVLRAGLWTAHQRFVPLLHALAKTNDNSSADAALGVKYAIHAIYDYIPFSDRYIKGHLGFGAVDDILVAKAFAEIWPITIEKGLAVRAAAREALGLIGMSSDIDLLDPDEHERSYCADHGFPLQVPVHEFMLDRVFEIAYDYFTWVPRDFNELDDEDVIKDLLDLRQVVCTNEKLKSYVGVLEALVDVLRSMQKLEGSTLQSEKDAWLFEFEDQVLQISNEPIAAVLRYLHIYESPRGVRPTLDILQVHSLLECTTINGAHITAEEVFRWHPHTHTLGAKAAERALKCGVERDIETRIFNVWPEFAASQLINKLDELKGIGHDHTIDFAADLVKAGRSRSYVQMLDIGAKMAVLESKMREKLTSLYSEEAAKGIEGLLDVQFRSRSETPLGRFGEFKAGMSRRNITYDKKISAIHFVTFGDLKDLLWQHTTRKDGRPSFDSNSTQKAELDFHGIVLGAFRNAWAHHQQLESGFEEFKKSYHFVREWVKSLEKRD